MRAGVHQKPGERALLRLKMARARLETARRLFRLRFSYERRKGSPKDPVREFHRAMRQVTDAIREMERLP